MVGSLSSLDRIGAENARIVTRSEDLPGQESNMIACAGRGRGVDGEEAVREGFVVDSCESRRVFSVVSVSFTSPALDFSSS